MSDNVVRALRLTGKVGFLSRGLWRKHFAMGNSDEANRWQRRQLALLVERGLLAPHANPQGKSDYFVLTDKSRLLLENENLVHTAPAPIAKIYHDESVAHWMLDLEKMGLVCGWKTEGELTTKQSKEYQLSRDVRNKKYPDAIFKVQALGKERVFAVEYERTRKSSLRYKDILWLYGRSDSVGMVIFVCENKFIREAIEGRLRYLNMANLFDRVALAQSADWHRDPATAPLQVGSSTITLGEICDKVAQRKMTLSIAL